MNARRLVIVLVGSFTLLAAASVQAQHKNELGLLIGGTKTSELSITGQNDKISFGTGLTFQANVARRILGTGGGGVFFEIPVLAAPLVDISSSEGAVPANYASLFITPSLRFQARTDKGFSPWVSVGGGFAKFDSSKELQDGSPNPGRIAANKGAIQFGGGADFRTPVKLFFPIKLRFELRDILTSKANYNVDTGSGKQHNLVFSGGFVVSF